MLHLAVQNFADREFYSAELGRATLQQSKLYHLIGEEDLSQNKLQEAKVLYTGIAPGGFPSTWDLEVEDFNKFICYDYK